MAFISTFYAGLGGSLVIAGVSFFLHFLREGRAAAETSL